MILLLPHLHVNLLTVIFLQLLCSKFSITLLLSLPFSQSLLIVALTLGLLLNQTLLVVTLSLLNFQRKAFLITEKLLTLLTSILISFGALST
jgi:hypothetical protein